MGCGCGGGLWWCVGLMEGCGGVVVWWCGEVVLCGNMVDIAGHCMEGIYWILRAAHGTSQAYYWIFVRNLLDTTFADYLLDI